MAELSTRLNNYEITDRWSGDLKLALFVTRSFDWVQVGGLGGGHPR